MTIESSSGDTQTSISQRIGDIEPIISSIPELKFYTLNIGDGVVNLSLELQKKTDRQARGQRSSQEVEKELFEKLEYLKSE